MRLHVYKVTFHTVADIMGHPPGAPKDAKPVVMSSHHSAQTNEFVVAANQRQAAALLPEPGKGRRNLVDSVANVASNAIAADRPLDLQAKAKAAAKPAAAPKPAAKPAAPPAPVHRPFGSVAPRK